MSVERSLEIVDDRGIPVIILDKNGISLLTPNQKAVFPPSQIGHAGEFLKTDGINWSWAPAVGTGAAISGTPVAAQLTVWNDASSVKALSGASTALQVGNTFWSMNSDPALANFYLGPTTAQVMTESPTLGHDNLFIGLHAGISCTDGIGNLGIGHSALASLTTGINNLAIGWDSQATNTTGFNNVSLGEDALKLLTTGSNNLGMGYTAGYNITTGQHNVAIGTQALYNTTTGGTNVAVGENALLSNTTGGNNVGIGYAAIHLAVTVSGNTAIGYDAGYNTTGAANTLIGYAAGFTSTAGASNVFIGYSAGFYETGSNVLMIDNAQRASEADARVKALMYGAFASTTAAQQLTVNGNVNVLEDLAVKGNGASGLTPLSVSGTVFAGTTPYALISPTGTAALGWSASGTMLGINAPSGFGGFILHTGVAGAAKFYVSSTGATGLLSLQELSDNNNMLITLATTGLTARRNVADANPAVILTQLHASSTGDVLQIKSGATTTARFPQAGGLSIGTTSDPGVGLIYTNSASFLIRTKTSYTDGAGGSLGTLSTAPSAGNPTKWIPVDDNGTTRYIPAW